MRFFKHLRLASALKRIEEEALYAAVTRELANGIRREGLWARAFAEANGDQEYAKALYLKFRVQAMRDEASIVAEARSKASQLRDELPYINVPVTQHETAEKNPHLVAAIKTIRDKGYMVFTADPTGWNVWSKRAGIPKDHCDTIGQMIELSQSLESHN